MTTPHQSFGKSFRKSVIHPGFKKLIFHPDKQNRYISALRFKFHYLSLSGDTLHVINYQNPLYLSFNIQQSINNKPAININIVSMFKLLLILCLAASQFYTKSYLVEIQENGTDYQGKDLNEYKNYLNKLELLQCQAHTL